MPIHLDDLDVVSEIQGLKSALIIPCYMCPAVSVAVREKKDFIQLFRHFLSSAPFSRYIKDLQTILKENGVRSSVFKSNFLHQWFLCMWTFSRRKKLAEQIAQYDAVIVLGCDSATETVRDLIHTSDCKVIRGMNAVGFMNAKMRLHWPCNVSFDDCKIIPLYQHSENSDKPKTA